MCAVMLDEHGLLDPGLILEVRAVNPGSSACPTTPFLDFRSTSFYLFATSRKYPQGPLSESE